MDTVNSLTLRVMKVANTARTDLKNVMVNGQQYNYNTRRNGQWATVQTTKCRRYTRKRRKDANEYDTGQYTQ